jgi:hypothetical protein
VVGYVKGWFTSSRLLTLEAHIQASAPCDLWVNGFGCSMTLCELHHLPSDYPKSTADMSDADAILDEHLAKFPPFKGPIIGGNFNVDENVLSGQELSFNVPVDG